MMSGTALESAKPSRGDLVRCAGCGTLHRHDRILSLCSLCGRRVRVIAKPRGRRSVVAAALTGILGGRK